MKTWHNCIHDILYATALRNHMRIVFEEMSSWTALTMYLGMKTIFETKYIWSKYVRIFLMVIFDFHNIIRKCILTLNFHFYPILWAPSCRELYFFKYAFSTITLKIFKPHNKKSVHICFSYICSKLLSSSLDTLLKVSRTTSPHKLFVYDCVTLYIY